MVMSDNHGIMLNALCMMMCFIPQELNFLYVRRKVNVENGYE